MPSPQTDELAGSKEPTSPYREFLATRDEILKYKWIESEKAGRDIGFEAALLGWAAARADAKE